MNKTLLLSLFCLAFVIADVHENFANNVSPLGWVFSGMKGNRQTSNCGSVDLLGGFDVAGARAVASKRFKTDQSQRQIVLDFDLYAIDSWDNEVFYVTGNGVRKEVYKTHIYDQLRSGERRCECGAWKLNEGGKQVNYGRIVHIQVTFDNNQPSFELQFSSSLNEDANNESWGVANFSGKGLIDATETITTSVLSQTFVEGQQPDGWVVTGNQNNLLTTNCAGTHLLGGFKSFGLNAVATKNFRVGQGIQQVVVKVRLFALDSWDAESFYVVGNNVKKEVFQTQWQSALLPDESRAPCGNDAFKITTDGPKTFSGKVYDVLVAFDVSGKSAFQLQLTSNINQNADDESWGISSFQIYGLPSPQPPVISTSPLRECVQAGQTQNGWVQQGMRFNQEYTQCGEAVLIGGFNAAGRGATASKNYRLDSAIDKVQVDFDFYAIDSWDNEKAVVTANGVSKQLYQVQLDQPLREGEQQVNCGAWTKQVNGQKVFRGRWLRLTAVFDVNPSKSADFNLQFSSTLDEGANNESWGVTNIVLTGIVTYVPNITTAPIKETFQVGQTPNGWDVVGNSNGLVVTNCGGVHILGGYNAFGRAATAQKRYTADPKLSEIIVKFRLYAIDTWDNQIFYVSANGQDKQVYQMQFNERLYPDETRCPCGSDAWTHTMDGPKAYYGKIVDIFVKFDNTQRDFTLKFSSNIDEAADNESWGITNLEIYGVINNVQTITTNPITQKFEYGQNPTGWVFKGTKNNQLFSQCADQTLLGGYNVAGNNAVASQKFLWDTKVNQIVVEFDLYAIDSWDNQIFYVSGFGINKQVYQEQFNAALKQNEKRVQCGGRDWTFNENNQKSFYTKMVHILVAFDVDPKKEVFEVILSSNIDENPRNESWGIQNFSVYGVVDNQQKISVYPLQEQFVQGYQNGWKQEGMRFNQEFTQCGSDTLLGGFDAAGKGAVASKKYLVEDNIDSIRVEFDLYAIDSWDNEKFYVTGNGVSKEVYQMYLFNQLKSGENMVNCGLWTYNENNQLKYRGRWSRVSVTFDNKKASSFELKFSSNLDEQADNESWGIKNLVITGVRNIVQPNITIGQVAGSQHTCGHAPQVNNAYLAGCVEGDNCRNYATLQEAAVACCNTPGCGGITWSSWSASKGNDLINFGFQLRAGNSAIPIANTYEVSWVRSSRVVNQPNITIGQVVGPQHTCGYAPQVNNAYLAGCVAGDDCRNYATLQEAAQACCNTAGCGGVTWSSWSASKGNDMVNFGFQLRAGNSAIPIDSTREVSWVRNSRVPNQPNITIGQVNTGDYNCGYATQVNNAYLSGCVGADNCRNYATLQEAAQACCNTPGCGGITWSSWSQSKGNDMVNFGFQLRAGNSAIPIDSTREVSWALNTRVKNIPVTDISSVTTPLNVCQYAPQVNNSYLSGCVGADNCRNYATLQEAANACCNTPGCGGITWSSWSQAKGNDMVNFGFQLRAGNSAIPIDTTREISWVLKSRNRNCPVAYTQCDYQGEALQLCDNVPSTATVYRSVRVPNGWTVNFFPSQNYQGSPKAFKQSVSCSDSLYLVLKHESKQNLKKQN